jgi:hypothetical protein
MISSARYNRKWIRGHLLALSVTNNVGSILAIGAVDHPAGIPTLRLQPVLFQLRRAGSLRYRLYPCAVMR